MKHENDNIVPLGHINIDMADKFELPGNTDLPILPTRNLVMFPNVTFPIILGRDISIKVAERSESEGMVIGILCQRNPDTEMPSIPDDMYEYGVLGKVVKIFDIPNGPKTAIVRSDIKFRVVSAGSRPLHANVEFEPDALPSEDNKQFIAVAKSIKETALEIIKKTSDVPSEFSFNIEQISDPMDIINHVATHMPIDPDDKQRLLKYNDVTVRGYRLLTELKKSLELIEITQRIQEQTRSQLSENQKMAFLQQQMETIRQEIYGDDDDATLLRARAEEIALPQEVRDIFDKEVSKLSRLNPQSPDYSVQYSYLDTLLTLPWNSHTPLNASLADAQTILDEDHYGLEKIKTRIIEQLAVMMHKPDGKAPILCLVGPPGVGKTSLGKSIARALGRKYRRISLGGLHDESEIRGHRRTYIGAMPGRIIDAIKRAGSANPVLMLDEIDKIGKDMRGDPEAALLEVLDPEQNAHFHDNYIDVDFDLSSVLFIATANSLQTISQPLLDRMEVIDISGYLQEEKVEIAKRHLYPRMLQQYNLNKRDVTYDDDAYNCIIEGYTSESGVRQLEKKIAAIGRKVLVKKMKSEKYPHKIKAEHVKDFLGVSVYSRDHYEGNDFAGVVTGLAWTSVGGEILYIETSPAKSNNPSLSLTGNLGDVMKESAHIALQYVRSHAAEFGIDPKLFSNYSLHIHVPEGAIPKDGPSAGITMVSSIVSALTQRKVKPQIAMTGEITLRGRVLPVGGIKEKILAAKRAGISSIILSKRNKKDIDEIPSRYLEGLTFTYVDTIPEVISAALLDELVDNPIEFEFNDRNEKSNN